MYAAETKLWQKQLICTKCIFKIVEYHTTDIGINHLLAKYVTTCGSSLVIGLKICVIALV